MKQEQALAIIINTLSLLLPFDLILTLTILSLQQKQEPDLPIRGVESETLVYKCIILPYYILLLENKGIQSILLLSSSPDSPLETFWSCCQHR